MKDFMFRMPAQVRFGEGLHERVGELLIREFGCKKVFVATDLGIVNAGIIAKVEAGLKAAGLEYLIYDRLTPDPTIEMVDEGARVLAESGADAVLAVGGGSPIDTAKAMCLLQTHEGSIRDYLFGGTKTVTKPIMPLACIPTTAGTGSEMTAASVITNLQDQTKVSVTHDYLIPRLAVIDPVLQMGMPPFITAATGIDALTHAIEAYVSRNAEPMTDALALAAIKLIAQHLRTAVADGTNLEARSQMAIASTMAGAAFMNGGLGVVHGIGQSLGAAAHVPHGTACSLLLPYCMKRNVPGHLEKFCQIAIAMGQPIEGLSLRGAAFASVQAVFGLAEDVNVPLKLSSVGVTREMFPAIIRDTMAYRLLGLNPCKLNEKDIEAILEEAF